MNTFDTIKCEIKELVDLAVYIERFDSVRFSCSIEPTQDALKIRIESEKRYITLLNRYTV